MVFQREGPGKGSEVGWGGARRVLQGAEITGEAACSSRCSMHSRTGGFESAEEEEDHGR